MSAERTPIPLRLVRLARLNLHLLHGVATAMFLLPRLSPAQQEQQIRAWCSKLLAILNVRVVACGEVPDPGTRATLFVANHISWIDIWALKQQLPIHLVAKSEIRGWPVIGWLAEKSGTLFIERERRHDTRRVLLNVEQALRQEQNLCFFPEGTTTDGTELRPFKSSLFQAAINAKAVIRPLAIHYPAKHGGTNTAIAYAGDTTMLQSLRAVLKQREIVVELRFAPPLPADDERRHLAHQARITISSLLHPRARMAPDTVAGLPAASR